MFSPTCLDGRSVILLRRTPVGYRALEHGVFSFDGQTLRLGPVETGRTFTAEERHSLYLVGEHCQIAECRHFDFVLFVESTSPPDEQRSTPRPLGSIFGWKWPSAALAAPPRCTLRTSMTAIAIFALFLAPLRLDITHQLLGSSYHPAWVIILRYTWIWIGLALAAFLVDPASARLRAYAWVLAGSLIISFLAPARFVAIEPDYGGWFSIGTFFAAVSLWTAGWIMGKLGS